MPFINDTVDLKFILFDVYRVISKCNIYNKFCLTEDNLLVSGFVRNPVFYVNFCCNFLFRFFSLMMSVDIVK